MQKQQMVYLPLKDIKPYENNPRKTTMPLTRLRLP